jgi:hypothetical protein
VLVRRRTGHGEIVNTASNSAFRPTGSSIPYMTSNATLAMLEQDAGASAGTGYPDQRRSARLVGYRWAEEHLPPQVGERMLSGVPPTSLVDAARAVVFLGNDCPRLQPEPIANTAPTVRYRLQ